MSKDTIKATVTKQATVTPEAIDLQASVTELAFNPKTRVKGSIIPLCTSFETVGNFLKQEGHTANMQGYIDNGTFARAKEQGIRSALFTGFLSEKDLQSTLNGKTGTATPKVQGMIKADISVTRTLTAHLQNLTRLQGTKQGDGYKAGAVFKNLSIPSTQVRDAFVQAGFSGLSDITTFPCARIVCTELGHSVKVPDVASDTQG